MKKILITVPNGNAYVHKHVMMTVIKCLSDGRHNTYVMAPTHRPYEHNLNRCAKQMLDDGCDYWLSMDDDNPPINNPLDLVQLDLDFVGFPTPVWYCDTNKPKDQPWYFNALDRDEENDGWKPHSPLEGLQEVDAVGSGCFLMSRRVAEAVRHPFQRRYDENGIVTHGHDYLFCQRVKEAGFKVWAHYDYPCRHFVELELLEAIQAIHSMERSNG